MATRHFRNDDSMFARQVEETELYTILTGAPVSGKSNSAALLTEQRASVCTPIVLFDQEGNYLTMLPSSPQADEQALTDAWNMLQAVPAYIERYQRATNEQVQA